MRTVVPAAAEPRISGEASLAGEAGELEIGVGAGGAIVSFT